MSADYYYYSLNCKIFPCHVKTPKCADPYPSFLSLIDIVGIKTGIKDTVKK